METGITKETAASERPFEGVVRGRWLWTGERLLVRGGVQVMGGRVTALLDESDPDPPGSQVLDLARALLHPGLLDAHAHLDLSALGEEIPSGLPFPEWLLRVRGLRLAAGDEGLAAGARAGLKALLASGTARVVDFSYGGRSEEAVRESGIRAAVLLEVIGPDPAHAVDLAGKARQWLLTREPGDRQTFGLAPHSPYLVAEELLSELKRISRERPFSIHGAEITGEAELLREGTGDLRQFLDGLGIPIGGVSRKGAGPVEYLDRLGALEGALLVHGNCLEENDLERIRRRRGAVVFCPRSHRYFGRGPHPLPALLEAGIPAALGTDSILSSGRLSMADEMREVRRQFPAIPARTVFALGTGALLDPRIHLPWPGTLEPGGPADLAAAEVPGAALGPLEALLDATAPNVLTLVGGVVLH